MCVYIYIYTKAKGFINELQRNLVYCYLFRLTTCFGLCSSPSSGHKIYRIIHKSLRVFRSLRYSSWDGHAEGEHVNKGRDTPNFCPTFQVLDMLLSAVSVLVVAQLISAVPEGLLNYSVYSVEDLH